jgi:hypothetical protein
MLFYMGVSLGMRPEVSILCGNVPENSVMRRIFEITGEVTGG